MKTLYVYRHKIEQIVKATWHIKDMTQLSSNSRALPTLLLLHFVSSLNVPTYVFNDVRGSIVGNVRILALHAL